MEICSGASDSDREEGELEREDGEIVDDLEDISDISIPSCGKSDYSQDLLRAISLSSISDSDGAREHNAKKFLPTRKKRKENYHRCKRKRKRSDIFSSYSYRSKRHRSSSPMSSSSDDATKLDKRTLRQLKEAVRINVSHDLHHNSLRTRLKAMIEPDEEDVEALRALALLTNKNDNSNNEDKTDANEKQDDNDETLDKELAELRLEALKSAVIKKHNERKKRKLEQNAISDNNISNDKENTENNIISEIAIIKNAEVKPDETSIEDDVDVMRAMLLASMSTKIASNKAPIVANNKSLTASTPIALNSKRVVTNKTIVKSKTTLVKKPPIKMPSVKPLIINLNSDSESDDQVPLSKQPENNPIDKSVTEFLRKQREEFEAKQAELEKSDENLLDKSVLKLLSKSQQTEYQLLKQKLLLASRKRKVRRLSGKSLKNNGELENATAPNNLKKTLQELQVEKDGRLQMKGKYKELAPLIQKVNLASGRRKQCEERIKKLLGLLSQARTEHSNSHQVYTQLVQKLTQAKDNIDVRLYKLANGKKATSVTVPICTKTTVTPSVTPKAVPETKVVVVVVQENNVTESAIDDNRLADNNKAAEIGEPKYPDYVSPLDNDRNGSKNASSNNPLQMLCPYELFGVCKDQDCAFNHCP